MNADGVKISNQTQTKITEMKTPKDNAQNYLGLILGLLASILLFNTKAQCSDVQPKSFWNSIPVTYCEYNNAHEAVAHYGYLNSDGSFEESYVLKFNDDLTGIEGSYLVRVDVWVQGADVFGWDADYSVSSEIYTIGYLDYYVLRSKATGSVQVTISPSGAVKDGAQWQVNGGAWLVSGAKVNLPVGKYNVTFKSIAGWYAPSNQSVTVSPKQTTQVTGTYQTNAALLKIQSVVLGSSPTYREEWLQVGKTYSIIIKPAKGFTFLGWSGSIVTNTPKISFTMAPGMNLTATYKDVAAPKLKVTYPKKKLSTTNAVLVASGTTKENWKMAAVTYSLNNGSWLTVSTTNGFTNWTASINLSAGTNTIRIRAQDQGGNYSLTNTSVVTRGTTATKLIANSVVQPGNPPIQMQLDVVPASAPGAFAFTLQSSANVDGHVEYSSDMIHWNTLTNFSGTNMPPVIQDPTSVQSPMRFYRVVVP